MFDSLAPHRSSWSPRGCRPLWNLVVLVLVATALGAALTPVASATSTTDRVALSHLQHRGVGTTGYWNTSIGQLQSRQSATPGATAPSLSAAVVTDAAQQASDNCGSEVATAVGDVNGDSLGDLVIGCDGDDTGVSAAGAVLVKPRLADNSGWDAGVLVVNPTPVDSDACGTSVEVGDVNADGLGDLVVGCRGDDTGGAGSGNVIVFTSNGGSPVTFDTTGIELANPSPGADECGYAVATADVDANGWEDVVMGCQKDDNGGADRGRAYVFTAQPGVTVTFAAGVPLDHPSAADSDSCGRDVAAGDVNGDGLADVVVGCTNDDTPNSSSGSAVVFRSLGGSPVSFAADQVLTPPGAGSTNEFCHSVALGDVNDDGLDDVAVGCPHDLIFSYTEGRVAVFPSAGGSPTTFGAGVTLTDPAADAGQVCGYSVAMGDLDGDGAADVVAGCPRHSSSRGKALYWTSNSGAAPTFDAGVELLDPAALGSDQCGQSVYVSDVDTDGTADVLMGCNGDDALASAAGSVVVGTNSMSVAFGASQVLVTQKANRTAMTIKRATLDADLRLNGRTATWQLTANGGANWENVTAGTEHVFTTTGTDLRIRGTLTSAANATAVVTGLAVEYADNLRPATPVNSAPTANATIADATPTLAASAFSDPEANAHTSSRWQVRTDAGSYGAPAYDSTEVGDLVSHTTTSLADGVYWFRVRYTDSATSESFWSTETKFTIDTTTPPSGVTVSGFAYEGETSTAKWSQCNGSTSNVSIAVAGTLVATVPCHGTTGAFTFSSVTLGAADQVVTVYLDDSVAGNDGATYTRNADTTTDIVGLAVTDGRVAVRSESATSMSNAGIAVFDATHDTTDLAFVASDGTNLVTSGSTEVHVDAGETFVPGGNVTATSLHVEGTHTGGAGTLTLTGSGTGACEDGPGTARPLCVDGGTFAAPATTLFQGAADSDIQGAAYNVLRLEPVSGITPWYRIGAGSATVSATQLVIGVSGDPVALTLNTHSPTLTVNGPLSVGCSSTFAGSVNVTTTVTGSVSGCGNVDLSGGTFVQRVAGATNFGFTGGGNDWDFNHLTFESSSGSNTITVTTTAGATTHYVAGDLTVAVNTTLDNELNDRVLDVAGDVVVNGTLQASSSAAFTIGGDITRGASGTITPGATGTITLDGTAPATLSWSGPTSLRNLVVATADKEVRFDNVDQTTVLGNLTVDGGACGDEVLLRSDSVGNRFELDVDGTASIDFADVQDMANTSASTLTANDSTDSLNNANVAVLAGACAKDVALDFVTGFEHGAVSSAGQGLFQAVQGVVGTNAVVTTSSVRNGSYGFTSNTTSASGGAVDVDLAGTVAVGRVAINFEDLPTADLGFFNVQTGVANLSLGFNSGTQRPGMRWGAAAPTTWSLPAVTPGQWYVIDFKVDVSNPTTARADWRVNGISQTPVTLAIAGPSTIDYLRIGRAGAAGAGDGFIVHYDDVAASDLPGDFPIGDGKVLALRPDGRVANGTDTNFTNQSGVAFGALSHLAVDDSPMGADSSYLRQNTNTTGTAFADLSLRNPSGTTAPRGVRGVVAHRTDSGGAASAGARFRSGATETSVHAGAMPAALEFEGAMLTAPGGDGWSVAELDALTARVGYATSITDEPRWDAVLVEAEFPVSAAGEPNLAMRIDGYDATGAGPHVAPATTDLGSLLPGSTAYAESRVTITTDAAGGYTLAASDPDTNGALYSSAAATSIPWMDCSPAPVCSPGSPGAWAGSGVAISAFGGANTPPAWCNANQALCPDTGIAGELQDPDLRWAPLTPGAAQVTSAPGPTPAGDTTRIPIRLTVPTTQTASSYSGEIAFTATAVP